MGPAFYRCGESRSPILSTICQKPCTSRPHAFQNLSTCFILRYNKQTNIVPSFQKQYPTYLSLIETEEMEAMSIINLLKFLNAQYVDIWFHPHSETAARYVYEQYVLKVTKAFQFCLIFFYLKSFQRAVIKLLTSFRELV